jgi:hypothetical protein
MPAGIKLLLAGITALFLLGCHNLNPFARVGGPELFPTTGTWKYLNDDGSAVYRTFAQPETARYLTGGKPVKIEIFPMLDSSNGRIRTYTHYLDQCGLYWYSEDATQFTPLILFPIYPGKSWAVENIPFYDENGTPRWCHLTAFVEQESVSVPAGDFNAYRVELNFYDYTAWVLGDWIRRGTLVRWYVPEIGIVKESAAFNFYGWFDLELVSYEGGAR